MGRHLRGGDEVLPDAATHRIANLDGLRGLAVLLVLVSHVSSYHAEQAGPAGVAIFFTLSGFLITSLLLAERGRFGSVHLGFFYARRALRLLPALFLLVAATPVVLWLAHDPRMATEGEGLLTALLYVQDFATATGNPSVLGHVWSLAVEEQFYLIWPLVLGGIIGLSRADPLRVAAWTGGLAVLGLLLHLADIAEFSYEWAYYSPDSNAVFLLAGCALAAFQHSGRTLRVAPWAAYAALVLVMVGPLLLTRVQAEHWRLQAALMVPVTLCGVPLIAGCAALPALRLGVLRWFGTVSYGLYLWNWLLISLQPDGRGLGGSARLLAGIGAVGAAAASWYLVESRVLRFKSRVQRVRPVRSADVLGMDDERDTARSTGPGRSRAARRPVTPSSRAPDSA